MVLAYWHNHLLEIMLLCDTYLSGRAHWWYDVADSMSTMIPRHVCALQDIVRWSTSASLCGTTDLDQVGSLRYLLEVRRVQQKY